MHSLIVVVIAENFPGFRTHDCDKGVKNAGAARQNELGKKFRDYLLWKLIYEYGKKVTTKGHSNAISLGN